MQIEERRLAPRLWVDKVREFDHFWRGLDNEFQAFEVGKAEGFGQVFNGIHPIQVGEVEFPAETD
jgi:hypothetical protein